MYLRLYAKLDKIIRLSEPKFASAIEGDRLLFNWHVEQAKVVKTFGNGV